jgi:hypothetical protein
MPHFDFMDEPVEPTPERLRHANDNHAKIAGGATRVDDIQVIRLQRAGRLTNVQLAAAEQYFADWYNAGLAPLGAVDYGKEHVDGSKPMTVSERRMAAADRYNAATAVLGRYARAIELVVLLDHTVEYVGRDVGYGNAPQARVCGIERLEGGLDLLAVHYRLLPRNARSRQENAK